MTSEEKAALREALPTLRKVEHVLDAEGIGDFDFDAHEAAVLALLDECERMREALNWYAKDYDYDKGCSQWDGGAKARAALGGGA